MHQAWSYFSENIKDTKLEDLMTNPSFLQTMFCESYINEELLELLKYYPNEYINKITQEKVKNMPPGNNIHQFLQINHHYE